MADDDFGGTFTWEHQLLYTHRHNEKFPSSYESPMTQNNQNSHALKNGYERENGQKPLFDPPYPQFTRLHPFTIVDRIWMLMQRYMLQATWLWSHHIAVQCTAASEKCSFTIVHTWLDCILNDFRSLFDGARALNVCAACVCDSVYCVRFVFIRVG